MGGPVSLRRAHLIARFSLQPVLPLPGTATREVDLLPYVPFDEPRFLGYARAINPGLKVVRVSATRGDGLDGWYGWLRARRPGRTRADRADR